MSGEAVGLGALRDLLVDALTLWERPGRVDVAGDALVVATAAGGEMIVRPAAMTERRARWLLRRADGRWRPSLSVTGLLGALRAALDVPVADRLRIAVDGGSGLAPPSAPGPVAPPDPGRCPVLVVTGFLGSGKTTLIQRLLRDPAYTGTAVIVNEFGAVALDHALMEGGSEVLLLPSGCLCCAVLGDLVTTLHDLERRRAAGSIAFERVVIETSGLADPAPVLQALMTDRRLARSYAVAGVVTLIDAAHGAATLPAYVEARRQVALASRIIVTKTDLAGVATAIAEAVAALNPGAPWVAAAHGAVPPDWLFAPSPFIASHLATTVDEPPGARHTDGIGSFTLTRAAPVPAVALTLLLQALAEHAGDRLLRVKGLVAVAEAPDAPAVVHGVRHVFEAPVWLDRWPADKRGTELVFIANALPPRFPGRLLEAIAAEVRDTHSVSPIPGPAELEIHP